MTTHRCAKNFERKTKIYSRTESGREITIQYECIHTQRRAHIIYTITQVIVHAMLIMLVVSWLLLSLLLPLVVVVVVVLFLLLPFLLLYGPLGYMFIARIAPIQIKSEQMKSLNTLWHFMRFVAMSHSHKHTHTHANFLTHARSHTFSDIWCDLRYVCVCI